MFKHDAANGKLFSQTCRGEHTLATGLNTNSAVASELLEGFLFCRVLAITLCIFD